MPVPRVLEGKIRDFIQHKPIYSSQIVDRYFVRYANVWFGISIERPLFVLISFSPFKSLSDFSGIPTVRVIVFCANVGYD